MNQNYKYGIMRKMHFPLEQVKHIKIRLEMKKLKLKNGDLSRVYVILLWYTSKSN